MSINHTSKYAELTDNQFLLIGKLTIEFANIEFLLGQILCKLLITPIFLGRTYTERMNITSIIEKIRNAVDIHERRYRYHIISKNDCDSILLALSKVEEIKMIRNKFAHYCWSKDTDDKIFGTAFLGKNANPKKPNEGTIILSNEEMIKTYESAYQVVDNLSEITYKLPQLEESLEFKNKLKYL